MNGLISIVIPNYNYAHFLERALESVIAQTYRDWEAIVVDNHSEDGSDEVVNARRDSRIRLVKIHNRGVIAASRNLGIRQSRGEWISFLDSDDCWYPTRLESVMSAIHSGACDVICNDEMQVDIRSGARRRLRHGPYQADFYKAMLVSGNRLSPSATTVRRDFLTRNALAFNESPDYVAVEDYDLWLHLARCGARFEFIGEVLGEFVVHQANSSASIARQIRNSEIVLRDHVFRVQQFNPAPNRLWRQVELRLRTAEMKLLVAERSWVPAVRLGLRTVMESPSASVGYWMSRAGRAARAFGG